MVLNLPIFIFSDGGIFEGLLERIKTLKRRLKQVSSEDKAIATEWKDYGCPLDLPFSTKQFGWNSVPPTWLNIRDDLGKFEKSQSPGHTPGQLNENFQGRGLGISILRTAHVIPTHSRGAGPLTVGLIRNRPLPHGQLLWQCPASAVPSSVPIRINFSTSSKLICFLHYPKACFISLCSL